MEKRNVVESGRTPTETAKTAAAVDKAAGAFKRRVNALAETEKLKAVADKKERNDADPVS